MKTAFTRTICRLLIVLMAWTPFQMAQAGMIGAGQAAAAAQTDRDLVAGFLSRADVARQLTALGLDAATAQQRAAAMSDEEVQAVAASLRSLPAGADAEGIAIALVIVFILWWIFWRKKPAT